MKWKAFLTCSLVIVGLVVTQSAWAAPAPPKSAAAPAVVSHPVAPPSGPTVAGFLARFIPCPLCSPRIPCPRCP